ncbi:unnamed protein product [Miscanthus lutarioriparius]|uniref:Uncharacterized protein n=1 Tax=Miscanthus lutarioriparius TaxID=422564 RepID=A0A811QGI7_9POAL|nr:unnamed protein product [Miscanthus lutarioriparius]
MEVEDLSRMFRLLSRINGGLPPVSKIFQEVLRAEKEAPGKIGESIFVLRSREQLAYIELRGKVYVLPFIL